MVNQEPETVASRSRAQLVKGAGQLDGVGKVLRQLLDHQAERVVGANVGQLDGVISSREGTALAHRLGFELDADRHRAAIRSWDSFAVAVCLSKEMAPQMSQQTNKHTNNQPRDGDGDETRIYPKPRRGD